MTVLTKYPRPSLRPGEVLLGIYREETHLNGDPVYCRRHPTKTLISIRAKWEESIDKANNYNSRWMQLLRHSDGTACWIPDWKHDCGPGVNLYKTQGSDCWADQRSFCPTCLTEDSLKVTLEAYGNRTECQNPACDYTDWFSIGD